MATYTELRLLFSDSGLRNKIEVACVIAAETIRTELDTVDNHANRLLWAKRAFTQPKQQAEQMVKALLASSKDSDVSAIQAVSDTALQTLVNGAIDIFADGS